ncbi:MAG: bifunctional adenosylcobinamide kinase/adenosylcobinamide-phosphate guanylyltransferase [Pseudomonadota bacterium]
MTLVLGGAGSGKSAFAEGLIPRTGATPVYIATAQAFDDEMRRKISDHQDQRGAGWITVEEPVDVASALAQVKAGQPTLIDCATMWLTNVILGEHDLGQQSGALLQALTNVPGPVVIVSNEVGQGIVPDNALSRRFRNAQGQLNQQIAQRADLVVAVMAGLPLTLKGTLP